MSPLPLTALSARLQMRKNYLDLARVATVTAATLLSDDTDQPITREELLAARKTSGDTAPSEPSDEKKYRPISLSPTLCEMLERIHLNRLLYKIGRMDAYVNGFV